MKGVEIAPEDRITFVISKDQDSPDPLFKAFKFIEKELYPSKVEYGSSFFDDASGYFIKDGITVCLEYTNWFGTELFIDKKYSDEEVDKVRKWVERILLAIRE